MMYADTFATQHKLNGSRYGGSKTDHFWDGLLHHSTCQVTYETNVLASNISCYWKYMMLSYLNAHRTSNNTSNGYVGMAVLAVPTFLPEGIFATCT